VFVKEAAQLNVASGDNAVANGGSPRNSWAAGCWRFASIVFPDPGGPIISMLRPLSGHTLIMLNDDCRCDLVVDLKMEQVGRWSEHSKRNSIRRGSDIMRASTWSV